MFIFGVEFTRPWAQLSAWDLYVSSLRFLCLQGSEYAPKAVYFLKNSDFLFSNNNIASLQDGQDNI